MADVSGGRGFGEPPSTRITLLTRLRSAGDAEAWRTFVDLYLPLVYRFCRRRGLQDADSRDVSQQVLAAVHRAIDSFHYDPQRGRFRNWLGTVTLHEILRHQHRDRKPGKGAGDGLGDWLAEQTSAPADPAWLEEFNAHMFSVALDRVRPEFDELTWQAFDATWLKDAKPREVAAQLDKPAAWIYKARFKVLQRLRSEIEFLTSDEAVFQRPT
ncbi:MAG: sigma-70 family RNA polymerase sigma factor [Pirellulaceae bacterium]